MSRKNGIIEEYRRIYMNTILNDDRGTGKNYLIYWKTKVFF
ncbi:MULTISPECIES: hypothetical protein [Bacillaceae]|nr:MULTISPECIES: hypothetical protein [Bacillaceae]